MKGVFIFIFSVILFFSCTIQKNKNNYEYNTFARCSHILDSKQRKDCEEFEYQQIKILKIEF